jgi:hypothetical protein
MDNWKLQLSMRPQKIWFYDLSVDPFEWNNIANNIDPQSIFLLASDGVDPNVLDSDKQQANVNSLSVGSLSSNYSACVSSIDNVVEVGGRDLREKLLLEQCHSVVQEIISSSDVSLEIIHSLCEAIEIAVRMDQQEMVPPLWPALSESPVSIDHSSVQSLKDEYIYWPN